VRIGVYGGSFNPPHVGHAMVAAWLRWADRVDEVWLLPVFGHAFSKALAPFDDRVALCEALAAMLPDVRVCTVERELPTPSYTIDTLRFLRARHPDHALRLVVGADVLAEAHRWRAWDEIQAEFPPIVVGRSGWPSPPGTLEFPSVSSTEIRRRVHLGEPVDALVPAALLPAVRRLWGA
jgi:nicotinate-nucleotide adenylyltransferase